MGISDRDPEVGNADALNLYQLELQEAQVAGSILRTEPKNTLA